MGILIVSGVILIASVFGMVRCFGEQLHGYNGQRLDITEELDSFQLPDFKAVSLDFVTTSINGDYEKIYVSNGLPIYVSIDSTVVSPSIMLPGTLEAKIDVCMNSDTLDLKILCGDFSYIRSDQSAYVTIVLPMSANLDMIDLKKLYFNNRLVVDDVSTDHMVIDGNPNATVECRGAKFEQLEINGIGQLDLENTLIDNIEVTNYAKRNEVSINASAEVNVGKMVLKGADVTYHISGLNDYDVCPDGESCIEVVQVYKSGNHQ